MTLDIVGEYPHELVFTSVRAPLVRARCTCRRWTLDLNEEELLERGCMEELTVLRAVTREHARHVHEARQRGERAHLGDAFY